MTNIINGDDMNFKDKQELKELDSRITQINNMLATPTQNNMTDEKEDMLNMELKYCYMRKKAIYKYAIAEMKRCGV